MEDNRSYFIRRAAQERSAATKARDSKVRAVHEDLAQRYGELAHENGSAPEQVA
jgi:hypothetical protein